MQIDHVAVWTGDLERLRAFYVDWFGAVAGEKYVNALSGLESYFLSFDGESRLEIMTRPELAEVVDGAESVAVRPGYTHLALAVGSEMEVDALTDRLRSAGVAVVDGPRRTGDGYYESVVLDPDGNRIEITV